MASKSRETTDPIAAIQLVREIIRYELVVAQLIAQRVILEAQASYPIDPTRALRNSIDDYVAIANTATIALFTEMEKSPR